MRGRPLGNPITKAWLAGMSGSLDAGSGTILTSAAHSVNHPSLKDGVSAAGVN